MTACEINTFTRSVRTLRSTAIPAQPRTRHYAAFVSSSTALTVYISAKRNRGSLITLPSFLVYVDARFGTFSHEQVELEWKFETLLQGSNLAAIRTSSLGLVFSSLSSAQASKRSWPYDKEPFIVVALSRGQFWNLICVPQLAAFQNWQGVMSLQPGAPYHCHERFQIRA